MQCEWAQQHMIHTRTRFRMNLPSCVTFPLLAQVGTAGGSTSVLTDGFQFFSVGLRVEPCDRWFALSGGFVVRGTISWHPFEPLLDAAVREQSGAGSTLCCNSARSSLPSTQKRLNLDSTAHVVREETRSTLLSFCAPAEPSRHRGLGDILGLAREGPRGSLDSRRPKFAECVESHSGL